MSGATSGGAAAGAVAAISNAIKACGTLVRIEPREFQRIVDSNPTGLYVTSTGGFFSTSYKYLTSYRGLAFHCKSPTPLLLPPSAEVIEARRMTIPEL